MKKRSTRHNSGGHASWWWLAINGPSCAASAFPMPMAIQVSPTPEQPLGFRTREEQVAIQRFLINAPIAEVERYMTKTVPAKIKNGEVVYMRPSRPEPPTEGPTLWSTAPGNGFNTARPEYAWIERMANRVAGHFGLDYSLDSLGTVDDLLEQVSDGLGIPRVLSSLVFGCYVGQVLVRHTEGEWVEDETMQEYMVTSLVVKTPPPASLIVSPITRCIKRIEDGERDGVEIWGRVVVAMSRQGMEVM